MIVHGPQCPKCTCAYHFDITDTVLECTNCGHRWQLMSWPELDELGEFLEKYLTEE